MNIDGTKSVIESLTQNLEKSDSSGKGNKNLKKRDAKSEEKLTEEKTIKVPLSAKERAQRSRDRKKHYTSMLEKKIKLLEEQMKMLTLELDRHESRQLFEKISTESRTSNLPNMADKQILQDVTICLKQSDSEGKIYDVH